MADMPTWWEIANSEIAKSLAGSALGAFAGAWAAQFIAERVKIRDQLLKEIRGVNAAVPLAYGITEAFLAIKAQFVKPLYDRYQADLADLLLHHEYAGKNEVFHFNADLRTIQPFEIAAEPLQQAVFGLTMAPSRVLALSSVIGRTSSLFIDIVTERNRLVAQFQSGDFHPNIYFGLHAENRVDLRYRTALEGISSYSDDLIFFSKLLGDDLVRYGKELREQLPAKFRSLARGVVAADFDSANALLPGPGPYKSWDTNFVTPEKPRSLNFWKATRPQDSY